MKRIACLIVLLALGLGASAAEAVTVNGRAGTDSWMITTGSGGQLVLTLYWKTRNALLFLRGDCDDGASFVSGSLQDRFQRVEIGVDPGTTCEVTIVSRRGSSKYYLNIQGTGIFGARTPDLDIKRLRRPRDRATATEGGAGETGRKSR